MLNKQPERIKIKTVNQSVTFSQVMTGFGTPESRLEELAILNGMNLTDQVEKGTLIKTVE
jgi:predicted Zn-dependent protease